MTNYLVWGKNAVQDPKENYWRVYLLSDANFKVRFLNFKTEKPITSHIPDFEKYINAPDRFESGWKNELKFRFDESIVPLLEGKLELSLPLINLGVQENDSIHFHNARIIRYSHRRTEFHLSQLWEVHSIYDEENFGLGVYGADVKEIIRSHLTGKNYD